MFKLVVALFVTQVAIVTVRARPSLVGLAPVAYSVPAGRITTASDGRGISTTVIEGPSATVGLVPAPALISVPGPISTTVIQAAGVASSSADGSSGDDGSSSGDDAGSSSPTSDDGSGSSSGGGEENSDEGQEATEPSVDESTAGKATAAAEVAPAPAVPVAPVQQPTLLAAAAPALVHSAHLVPAAAPAAVLITEGGSSPAAITFTGPAGKSVAIQASAQPIQLLAAPNLIKVW